MIHSVFELGDTIVREVMVPRTDMVFVERGKNLRQALSLALRSGFSRIPVVGENLDDVVGIAYLKDIVTRSYEHREGESVETVDSVMRPATFVPESKPIDELLREMQARQTHVAIVIDEYGGTAGLVTIEDILEEIVGEIADEYDREQPPVEWLGADEARVTARLPVEELAELFDVSIEAEDVETVGGLLAQRLGRVPIPGAVGTVAGLRLTAESLAGRRNRIGTVRVERIGPDTEPVTVQPAAERRAHRPAPPRAAVPDIALTMVVPAPTGPAAPGPRALAARTAAPARHRAATPVPARLAAVPAVLPAVVPAGPGPGPRTALAATPAGPDRARFRRPVGPGTRLARVSEAHSEEAEPALGTPDPEDVKIITLARSARARVAAAEGAAVRDETGRTYAAAAVALPSLRLSALHLAVAMAVSSGASSLEAAALVSDGPGPDPEDLAAVRDLGPDAVIFHAAPDGTLRAMLRT